MSVLIFAENQNGQFKKTALEAVTYGSSYAKSIGQEAYALVLGNISNPESLGQYGAVKVLHVAESSFGSFDSQSFSSAISAVAQQIGANTVILSNTSVGKAIAGRVAVRLKAGLVSGANALPTTDGVVSKSVFSGKAIANLKIVTPTKVISLMGNAIKPAQTGSDCPVEIISVVSSPAKTKVISHERVEGQVPLPEAERVVSAGRGLKGPENWGMIEDLAHLLGATTACSRPVADAHWRPHHEHVGQTGIAIRPNLYIAIGISGAIQHLAGVNNSKVIVVINKDPEAPFFKAADYGVVGDLFEVVPKLTAAIKQLQAASH
jgi:electron transfer flavoprotein alpha subunit